MTSQKQRRFAGIVAWERDLKITTWPETSVGLSALIDRMQAEVPPAPITEKQVELIQERVEKAIVAVPDFDPSAFAELPDNRKDANRVLRALDTVLGQAEKTSDLSSFVTHL